MTDSTRYSRPQSLSDVAERVLAHGLATYTATIKEFLDEYRARRAQGRARLQESCSGENNFPSNPDDIRAQRIAMVQEAPKLLNHAIFNAHIAGLAEHILLDNGVPPTDWPDWINAPERFLVEPAYFGGRHAREILMVETPVAFRRRLLFCGRVYL